MEDFSNIWGAGASDTLEALNQLRETGEGLDGGHPL